MSQFIDILRQHLADFRRRYAHQITPEIQACYPCHVPLSLQHRED